MTKWYVHAVHMAKHMKMVGSPFRWGGLGPGSLTPPKCGAAAQYPVLCETSFSPVVLKIFCMLTPN